MSKFKTLATIVSFIYIILPFSSGAATQWTTTSGTAYIALNNGLAEFANGDSIKLSGVSSFLLTTGNHIIAAIDINDSNSLFIVSNDVTLGSVANSGITGQSLMISYGGAQTVTLSGTAGSGGSTIGLNDYSSLASVDFNNKDGILELNSVGVNYADNFQSTGGDNGTIKVLQNSTLSGVFNGTSGTMVKALVVAEDKSLVLNTTLNLSDVATLKSNTTLTVNSGFSINANRLELEGDNPSSLIFAHNTTLNAEILNLNPSK